MTDVIQAFTLTIPANGNINTLSSVAVSLGIADVERILVTFPPGCSGLVGVRIEKGGSRLYPQGDNTWFIFDSYTIDIPVSGVGDAGQWQVSGYNTDVYDHTIVAYFYWSRVELGRQATSTPLVSL